MWSETSERRLLAQSASRTSSESKFSSCEINKITTHKPKSTTKRSEKKHDNRLISHKIYSVQQNMYLNATKSTKPCHHVDFSQCIQTKSRENATEVGRTSVDKRYVVRGNRRDQGIEKNWRNHLQVQAKAAMSSSRIKSKKRRSISRFKTEEQLGHTAEIGSANCGCASL